MYYGEFLEGGVLNYGESKKCTGCAEKFRVINMMRRSTGWYCSDCDSGPTVAQGSSRPGGPKA